MKRIMQVVMAVVMGIAVAFCMPAKAATGTWTGGSGATWDTTANNWSGVTGTPWDSSNGMNNTAYLNTPAATPAVSGTVYVNGLTFDNTATISGGTIWLAGSSPTITVNAGGNSTISSGLSGTNDFVKAGTGTLTLSGAYNGCNSNITINAGTLGLSTILGQNAWHGGTITVNSMATLSAGGNPFGYSYDPLNFLPDIFVNGGTVTPSIKPI